MQAPWRAFPLVPPVLYAGTTVTTLDYQNGLLGGRACRDFSTSFAPYDLMADAPT